MTGLEIAAVGYMFAWAKSRVQSLGEIAGEGVDSTARLLLKNLYETVESKLGRESREMQRLRADAESDDGELREGTERYLSSSLEGVMEDDPDFATAVRGFVEKLNSEHTQNGEAPVSHYTANIKGNTRNFIQGNNNHGNTFG
ncbi:hypothetical protein ABZ439_27670 [Streptomyces sp. NPDC005840]|uniref:Uncharacterized protein n=1 Tax=Streptomyces doudnae TaxID=3075536 RepID=A0ABD5EEZ9_9ACTN|nr:MULTISPECIES: hypothetical protein [unclassified Streptomyces]MDT0433196.1 hypothetical protein [Streptomyces sp. DSM 41981]MYQ63166.1 hypothetical protein [Streptomyces sp. SID4950]SCD52366.1 hypothetical protein GA0115242_10735 [Streptomyces sp. SolWspMP-5a-2]